MLSKKKSFPVLLRHNAFLFCIFIDCYYKNPSRAYALKGLAFRQFANDLPFTGRPLAIKESYFPCAAFVPAVRPKTMTSAMALPPRRLEP